MNKAIMFILLVFAKGMIYATPSMVTKTVEAEIILNLRNLNPPAPTLVRGNNYFDMDDSGNIYFCDLQNHRVIVFNYKGKYLYQVGAIGQGDADLYYPQGIIVRGDRLYILDQMGKKIKIFALDGAHIKTISIDDCHRTESLCILDNGMIVTESKFVGLKKYKKHPLVSVFNIEGKNVGSFGKIIQCENYQGYAVFNSIMLDQSEGRVMAAFISAPRISCYETSGKMIFDVDLLKLRIPEIQRLKNNGTGNGVDTPDDIKSTDGSIYSIIYCSGLAVRPEKGEIYYSINYPRLHEPSKYETAILVFNAKGEWQGRIIISAGGKRISTKRIIYHSGYIYGVGNLDNKYVLFKIQCSSLDKM